MLTAYLEAALRHATYDSLGDEGVFAAIPALPGVWGSGDSQGAAAADLREALEGWVVLALRRGIPIPEFDGVGLVFQAA